MGNTLKTIAIVQARMNSTRFPKKVMRKINGVPMIKLLLDRLSEAKSVDKIVLATSSNSVNDDLIHFVKDLGFEVFAGSENDVLDRYYQAALSNPTDTVIRITGDCPLVDPDLIDEMVSSFYSKNLDYLSNTIKPTYPDGLDIEIFTSASLKIAASDANIPYDREHVTPFLRNSGRFQIENYENDIDLSAERWTVDESNDFEVIKNVFNHFFPNTKFKWTEVMELKNQEPNLFSANTNLVRNEGAAIGTGQKLWKRAKDLIPGGNMLLSKRSEMFLPDGWPSYFSKAKGCTVWDLDGNEFIDMCIMGIGTNSLGYGHPEVDEAILKTVSAGNMSTLNCPEEVYLAEKLIELHPWADMVKYTRSGGEANAVALRIARAASGKDAVAICGYHGWHDWYLAANLESSKELNGHLLPGLEPKGVPQALLDTTHTFNYNDIEALKKLVYEKNIGVIFMEVMRNYEPEDDFLLKVRNIASENNIVLIFDECTSGFRETYGGLHLKYGVEPDIAMFGKALGNGYAINAIIGKREVMEYAQSTFISSTFWTERIGPAAALKTLEVMQKNKSWEVITNIGKDVAKKWEAISKTNNLKISISGLPALSSFSFISPKALEFKTYLTQEMLKRGILASNTFYACTEHKSEKLEIYFNELNDIFKFISIHQENIEKYIDGKVCHSGFKRIN
jgi:glutamate-1-semialdehyde 2,1-aminomutase